MTRVATRIDLRSSEFRDNAAQMESLGVELQGRLKQASAGGDEETRAKHLARGKLLPRERIEALLDPGSPFLELSPLAASGLYGDEAPAAGLVAGIGRVHGKEVLVVANDATVKGGTYYPLTVKKHLRAQEVALENRLPCIYLVDSGGAFLPLQDEVFPDRKHFGRIFYNQARLSAAGIPQVAVVMGSCTAGGGDVHAHTSSVVDHPADNDAHALAMAREIVSALHHCPTAWLDAAPTAEPAYPAEQLYGIVPRDLRQPYDVREVVARLVDGSEFHEFKALYGKTLVCGFANIWSYPVAILANNGILFSESALKGAHFVQLANRRRVPLVFLQNITGFMVGKRYENAGIVRDGAKMVTAVACSTVPKLTVVIGGSFGAGIREQYERQGNPYYATARLWDDGVIDPLDTRRVLGLALEVVARGPAPAAESYGVFRM